MGPENSFSYDHRQFMSRARLPGTISQCASGSSRFVIYPTGKISRCFGRNDQIGHLDDNDVGFVEKLRADPQCESVTCVDPCDLAWTDKRSIRNSDEMFFPAEIPWTGDLGDGPASKSTQSSFSLSLIQVNVTPTLLCNFNCPYCVAGSQIVNKKRAAGIQIDAGKLIRFLEGLVARYKPDIGLVVFVSGGESFLWDGLDEFSSWCLEQPRVSLKINTNGSQVDALRRTIKKFADHGALSRLFLQLSAHVEEPRFSEDLFRKVCDHVASSGVSYIVALVGDRSGRLSLQKSKFFEKIEFHPTKIYPNFLPDSTEEISYQFLEGH